MTNKCPSCIHCLIESIPCLDRSVHYCIPHYQYVQSFMTCNDFQSAQSGELFEMMALIPNCQSAPVRCSP